MVMVRHDADSRARIAKLEASRERGRWVAFTPIVKQGAAPSATFQSTYGYYHFAQNILHIEVYIMLSAAGTATQPIEVTGWPTIYNAACRAQRMVLGSFRLYDQSLDDSYLGHAVTYGDSIAGEQTNVAGQAVYGQTNSGFALALAGEDEISISAAWRV